MDKPAPDTEREMPKILIDITKPHTPTETSIVGSILSREVLSDKKKTKLKSFYFLEELLGATNGNCIWTSLKGSTETM